MSAMSEPEPIHDVDVELASMQAIYEAFLPLSREQRIRVLGAVLCLTAKTHTPASEAIISWKVRQE